MAYLIRGGTRRTTGANMGRIFFRALISLKWGAQDRHLREGTSGGGRERGGEGGGSVVDVI